MDKTSFINQVSKYQKIYNLEHWQIEFNNKKQSAGVTSLRHGFNGEFVRTISFSSHWITLMDDNYVLEIILHELAHAKVFDSFGCDENKIKAYLRDDEVERTCGHDFRWRNQCKNMGSNAKSNIEDNDYREFTKRFNAVNCR